MLSKIQAFLIPSFLKRLDFWLMTHKPHIWRTRGHFVIFYSLLAAFVMYFIGRIYPQKFADFFDNVATANERLVIYLTCFIGFVSVGILMWWWQSIQKFSYRRTNIGHFLIEIGIYTLGLMSISIFIFGFDKGLSHRQAFELEKNSREDSLWVVQNNFFQYGYMPHFQPNKEYNLKSYFKAGEELSQKMAVRESVVVNMNFDDDEEQYRYNKYNKAQGSTDNFSLSHWEYPKNQKLYARPTYSTLRESKTPADYVNKILTNDTFWKQEEKRLKFKEDDNVSREFLTDMTQADMNNLIDEVYPKYFKRINYFGQTQWISRTLVKQWMDKRLFLESLSEQEILIYKEYLTWLKGNFDLYAPQSIIAFEKNAAQGFFSKRSENIGDNFDEEKATPLRSTFIGSEEYFDENKGELAGEKLLHVFEKLDIQTLNYYLQYLQSEGYQEGIKANKKNPQYAPSCKNYFTQYTPKSSVDSLYHYDYYLNNTVTEQTWLNIIADEYAHYVANKYSEQDYQRLKNMMQLNGFEDVAAKSKNTTIQKISQLHQVDDYTMAIGNMLKSRDNYLINKKMTLSFFALTYCFLFAIMFYITTLSTGLQFWISAFVSGFFTGILIFSQEALVRFGGYTGPPNYSNNLNRVFFSNNIVWNKFLMVLLGVILLILTIILIFKKARISKAHIWFNAIFGSSLFGLYEGMLYWQNKVEITTRKEFGDREYYAMSNDERIKLYTLILLAAIGIYLIITWLFKRHLTLPKKK